MIGITTKQSGRVDKALGRMQAVDIFANLDHYGRLGVRALSAATPKEYGDTANSWNYRVIKNQKFPGIEWYNTHAAGDVSVAVLIQYGHATRNGGYVQGKDFINPAMKPIFEQIANDVWKKVRAA